LPETQIIFYQEEDGTVPVVEWLKKLKKKNPKGFINCLARIQQLQASGHELRRPASDYLRDDIRELRAKHRNVQYRIFYFFQGQNIAILAHAIIKKGSAVPKIDIEKTITRKNIFEPNPTAHTYQGEI
jgi:phage-related protein